MFAKFMQKKAKMQEKRFKKKADGVYVKLQHTVRRRFGRLVRNLCADIVIF